MIVLQSNIRIYINVDEFMNFTERNKSVDFGGLMSLEPVSKFSYNLTAQQRVHHT